MNVFLQELKMLRVGAVLWILALCGIVLMYTALYPTFSSDAELTKAMFANLPAAIKAALKIDVNAMLSFLGFFAFTFTNITLFAGIHAMHTGVSILSREHRSKTTDFLLSKPRSRSSVFIQKYTAGLTVIVGTWAAVTVSAFVLGKVFGAGDFSLQNFSFLMLALLMIQLWFFACGTLVAGLLRRIRSTIPVTLAVTFGFFMVGMLGAILGDAWLRYLSPFKFFDFVDIAAGKGFELVYVLVAAISFVVMIVMTYVMYTKKDVKAAE